MLKSVSEVRKVFWEEHPEFKGEFRKNKRQNEYRTDIRVMFVNFVDMLQRDGQISEGLPRKVTL